MTNNNVQKLVVAMTGTVLSLVAVSTPSFAVTFDLERASSSGLNDSSLTAQSLGSLLDEIALTARGFIDSNNPNDLDFYGFNINSGLPLDVYFDIDLASDVGSQRDLDTGLDSMLWVFDATGKLIAFNDDNDAFDFNNPEPGSSPFGDADPFIGALNLSPGTYFAVVSAFVNEPSVFTQPGLTFADLSISGQSVNGAISDFSFDNANDNFSSTGRYQLQIRTQVDDVPVPEPSLTFSLTALGLLGVGSAINTD